jgi:hypothetical protein
MKVLNMQLEIAAVGVVDIIIVAYACSEASCMGKLNII